MDLITILDTLSKEITKHEDRTDVAQEDTPTIGSVVADEVSALILDGLMNDDLKARIEAAQQLTSYDLRAFMHRYPRQFSSALVENDGT